MPVYIDNRKVGITTIVKAPIEDNIEDKYVFDTVATMKSSSTAFIEGDTIKVNGYYTNGDLVDSTLRYRVMSYENWWKSLPEDMRVVSYTAGWFGYKYIKTQVDEYGNHTLSNGLVAKLITDGTKYDLYKRVDFSPSNIIAFFIRPILSLLKLKLYKFIPRG